MDRTKQENFNTEPLFDEDDDSFIEIPFEDASVSPVDHEEE